MKVSARLMDWEEMAIRKPRPSAGMMVDWQMKLSTELTNCAESLRSSLLDTSVMLSVHTAALSPCGADGQTARKTISCQLPWLRLSHITSPDVEQAAVRMYVTVMSHLVATQAHVEQVEVLCAFGGETRSDGQRGHGAQRAEVKGQRAVVLRVVEEAVTEAPRMFLKKKQHTTLHYGMIYNC